MGKPKESITANWNGPYSWPKFEDKNRLQALPKLRGLYLWTFKYKEGYLIYAAGLTRRLFSIRFNEHTRKYMNGEYYVFDVDAIKRGVRKEIWPGWGYAKENRHEFDERKNEIISAVQKQLEGFCIFVADVGDAPRILERLEASIMYNLEKQPSPVCDIPDKGMHLSGRYNTEEPIKIINNLPSNIYGLPKTFEI